MMKVTLKFELFFFVGATSQMNPLVILYPALIYGWKLVDAIDHFIIIFIFIFDSKL